MARSTDTLVKTPTAITAISATITKVTTSAKPRLEPANCELGGEPIIGN